MKGGDRQPTTRAAGSQIDYAKELIDAMWENNSQYGEQFRTSYRSLLHHWHRWLVAVERWWHARHGGLPYHDFNDPGPFWDTLDVRESPYPKPKPLSVGLRLQHERRLRMAEAVAEPLYRALPYYRVKAEDPAFRVAGCISSRAYDWANEPYRAVNPIRKWRRSNGLHHLFRDDILAFCARWGLAASWAPSRIIHDMFFAAATGEERPFPFAVKGAFSIQRHSICIPLPGRSEEEVERSWELLLTAEVRTVLDDITVVQHPAREAFRAFEREHNLSCLLLDWDADGMTFEGPSFNQYARTELEMRLDRRLTKAESRTMARAIDRQVRPLRDESVRSGEFAVRPRGYVETYAEWCAAMLLNPRLRYEQLERPGATADAIRVGCRRFADAARLHWPPINGVRPRRHIER